MKTGDKLPNGAIVLVEKNGVVLALNNTGTRDEYVTWRWNRVCSASTCWGHYFPTLSAAALDFEHRAENQGWDSRVA